nr:MAG: hypothetical protein [Bacteriophage sp.]
MVEHLFYGILDVAYTTGYGLALRLHKTAELAALVREVDDSLFHFRETDFAFFYKRTYLVFCNPKHLSQFFSQRNTPAEELV